ncbi:MAG TPA: 23S rRNA (pseudouridine(1915)-N(3))-methyltransferase RlmH [Rhodanobacteraceae bacterium]|nr:23S rRNA (pseudouridine(1915)-N(3))-methyltransferase RlmH [Rhodanobacteraceae bacterium]
MRARISAIGVAMPAWLAEGFAEYQKRLSRELPLELTEIRPPARGRDLKRARAEEGEALLAAMPRDAHVIVLDGRGTAWSSEQLAEQLKRWRMDGRDLAFLIGGAEGHADSVLQRADQRWSLGPLTLPHMLVRLLVAEQLYRAAMIVAGHPYHRG